MKEKNYIDELKEKYGISEIGIPEEFQEEEPEQEQVISLEEED